MSIELTVFDFKTWEQLTPEVRTQLTFANINFEVIVERFKSLYFWLELLPLNIYFCEVDFNASYHVAVFAYDAANLFPYVVASKGSELWT